MLRRDERGTALLLSILATAVLGAGLMTVLTMSGSERRSVMNQQSQTDAWAIAQSGLEQFSANRTALGFASTPAAVYESTRVTVTGGYADVVLQRLRPAVGTASAVYVLRSTGTATSAQLAGTPVAERQVAQLATWSAGGMSIQSALTSIGGIRKTGANGTITGVDACGVNAAIAGVAVPSAPGYTQTAGTSVPAGTPAIQTYASTALSAAAVAIDWSGIVAGTAVTPNVVLPGGAWPSFTDTSVWPVIFVNGNYTLPSSGQGILIVTGALTISGSKTWKGVVLVGDKLATSGSMSIQGGVVTGLNAKLGQAVALTTLSGTNNIRHNSCYVASATARFGGLTVMPNAWMDNWAGW